jgi:hypothetical protein
VRVHSEYSCEPENRFLPQRQRKRIAVDETEEQNGGRESEEAEEPEELVHPVVKGNGTTTAVSPIPRKEQHKVSEKPAPSLSFYQRTNPHKPSAIAALHGNAPRRYTVSVALPGSIILNAQSPELQSRLAGQLARSCAIFNIDEIVVFNDGEASSAQPTPARSNPIDANGGEEQGLFDPNAFLARILQYVETPQYLRKSLFPMHRDLRMAGILAPLDCPHHLRYEEDSPYREGICVEAPHWATDNRSNWVFTGLRDPIECKVRGQTQGAASVPLGARVTVKMPEAGKKSAFTL